MSYSNLFAVLIDSIAIADMLLSFDVLFGAVREDSDVLYWEICPPFLKFGRGRLLV